MLKKLLFTPGWDERFILKRHPKSAEPFYEKIYRFWTVLTPPTP